MESSRQIFRICRFDKMAKVVVVFVFVDVVFVDVVFVDVIVGFHVNVIQTMQLSTDGFPQNKFGQLIDASFRPFF